MSAHRPTRTDSSSSSAAASEAAANSSRSPPAAAAAAADATLAGQPPAQLASSSSSSSSSSRANSLARLSDADEPAERRSRGGGEEARPRRPTTPPSHAHSSHVDAEMDASDEDDEDAEEEEDDDESDADHPAELDDAQLDFLAHLAIPPADAPMGQLIAFADMVRRDPHLDGQLGLADQIDQVRQEMAEAGLAGDARLRDELGRIIQGLEGEARHVADTLRMALADARVQRARQMDQERRRRREEMDMDDAEEGEEEEDFFAAEGEDFFPDDPEEALDRIGAMLGVDQPAAEVATTAHDSFVAIAAAAATATAFASTPPSLGISQDFSQDADGVVHTRISSIVFPSSLCPIGGSSLGRSSQEPDKHLVTASQVEHGRDVQGIPWKRLGLNRDAQRRRRRADYAIEVPPMADALRAKMTRTCAPAHPMFRFHQTTQAMQPGYHHTQLRHLLHAPTSSHEVFGLCIDSEIRRVNLRQGTEECAFDTEFEQEFAEAAAAAATATSSASRPSASRPTRAPVGPRGTVVFDYSSPHPYRLALTTIGVRPPLLFLGDMSGLLLIRNLATGKDVAHLQLTDEKNAIVNSITFCASAMEEEVLADGTLQPATGTGAVQFLVSDNDCFCRSYDLLTLSPLREIKKEVPINYGVASPIDGKQVFLCGDAPHAWLHDLASGDAIATLTGHENDIFSASFHPSRPLVATAAQDHTCRVYDLRRSDKSLFAFGGSGMAPMRSCTFGRTGDCLVMAEQADAVHIVDLMTCQSGQPPEMQTIDLFGEISGVALSPDDSSLFIGITDYVYGGCMEYQRAPKHVVDFFD